MYKLRGVKIVLSTYKPQLLLPLNYKIIAIGKVFCKQVEFDLHNANQLTKELERALGEWEASSGTHRTLL